MKIRKILAMTLSLVLTLSVMLSSTGCLRLLNNLLEEFDLSETAEPGQEEEQQERRTVKYSEMEYNRPDYDALSKEVHDVAALIEANEVSYDEQLAALNALDIPYYTYVSMYSLANIEFSINPSDSFWSGECDFFDETYATFMQEVEDIYVASANSPYKEQYEEDYYGKDFLDDYVDGGKMTDEMVALYQEEASTVTEYKEYDYDPKFEYNGVVADVYTHLENDNYVHFDKIVDLYYKQINQDLGELYVRIVKARQKIAAGQGYSTYADYVFDRELDRDYTAEEADAYVNDIIKYIVPLYKELNKANKLTMSGDPMGMKEKAVMNALCSVTSRMDPKFTEITDYMKEYELYYLGYNDEQTNESFTTYIDDYDAPFICIHGDKTANDLMTFVHEFGHFTDGYLNWNADYVLDQCECASQGLEYLFLCNVTDDDIFAGGKLYLQKMKNIDSIGVYISQSLFHYFESQVYKLSESEITVDRINEIAADAVKLFGLENDENYMDFDMLWGTIPHFFNQAFYVISYVTSLDVSLEIYKVGLDNAENGTKLYFKLLEWDEDMSFVENVNRAGLDSPFKAGHVEAQANFLRSLFE